MGGTGTLELGPIPLVGRVMSRDVFSGQLWGQLIDGTVFLPCWLFGLKCPSIGAYRLLGRARSW